ncbi:MAG: polysaccharide biosynthesis tyrosine autokinase [Candidatus Omnitrophota bacterium]
MMDFSNWQEFERIKDYIEVLRRRRDVIKIFFITTVLVVTLGSFLMRPVYQARVTLLIDVESPNVLTTSGTVAMQSSDYYSYKDYLQTQIQILTSRPIIHQVINELNLMTLKEFAKAKDPVENLLKTIKVEPDRDTRLINVYVDNKNPELAAKIANRLTETYVIHNLIYISKNEFLNLMKNEYLKLQSKLSEYAKIYKEEHPEMIRLRKEIADTVENMEQEKNNISNYGAENTTKSATSHSTLEALKANNVSIIEPAEVPIKPIKPKKSINILLAIILGAFGGVGLAFFLEYLDDVVRGVEELEHLTNWPFLGSIPVIDAENKLSELQKDIFVQTYPKTNFSEAYRTFRTNVIFSSTEEHPVKKLLITSPGPAEGKTITLCNLGIAIAQSKKSVLLVDGDMRKPRLHEIFQKKINKGLSNFLCGQAEFVDLPQDTMIEHLSIVSSGNVPPNPSELLASHKLKEFLQQACEKFDYVIFDSPPVSLLTDASLIARVVDGMVIVVENGKTSKRALERIAKNLKGHKVRILGTFLNKAAESSKNYYSYY